MTLQPIKDVSEYRRLKQTLRDRFDNERTEDQNLFEEQTKKYKPLLTSQQEISKTMQDAAKQIVESQNEGQTALQPLLPLLQNIQRTQIAPQIAAPRRQLPSLASAISTLSNYATPQTSLPGKDTKTHIPQPVAPATSRRDPIEVDLDEGFDREDVDNLIELNLPLPSEVYNSNTITQTLEKIKTCNKSIGQYLGTGPSSKKISNAKKLKLESQRDTLKKYKDRLENTEAGKKLLASHKSD